MPAAVLPANDRRLARHRAGPDQVLHAEHLLGIGPHAHHLEPGARGQRGEFVRRMLGADGFILESESDRSQAGHARIHVSSDARTLFFKRPGAQAIAVLFSDGSGRSVIVLNRVNFARNAK